MFEDVNPGLTYYEVLHKEGKDKEDGDQDQ